MLPENWLSVMGYYRHCSIDTISLNLQSVNVILLGIISKYKSIRLTTMVVESTYRLEKESVEEMKNLIDHLTVEFDRVYCVGENHVDCVSFVPNNLNIELLIHPYKDIGINLG